MQLSYYCVYARLSGNQDAHCVYMSVDVECSVWKERLREIQEDLKARSSGRMNEKDDSTALEVAGITSEGRLIPEIRRRKKESAAQAYKALLEEDINDSSSGDEDDENAWRSRGI